MGHGYSLLLGRITAHSGYDWSCSKTLAFSREVAWSTQMRGSRKSHHGKSSQTCTFGCSKGRLHHVVHHSVERYPLQCVYFVLYICCVSSIPTEREIKGQLPRLLTAPPVVGRSSLMTTGRAQHLRRSDTCATPCLRAALVDTFVLLQSGKWRVA